jgi:hypothetical protein
MRSLIAVLALVCLASCGGSEPTAPVISVSGNWTGTISQSVRTNQQLFTLALTESNGNVTGTGFIWSTNATVSGTYSAANGLTAVLTVPGRTAITFRATVVLPNSMAGTVSGGGLDGEVATLTKP